VHVQVSFLTGRFVVFEPGEWGETPLKSGRRLHALPGIWKTKRSLIPKDGDRSLSCFGHLADAYTACVLPAHVRGNTVLRPIVAEV